MLCSLPCSKVWAHLSPFPCSCWGQAQQEWGPNPLCTFTAPSGAARSSAGTVGSILWAPGQQWLLFWGKRDLAPGQTLCSGLIVMAAAQEVSWSTPPRNLYSGNTLASRNNWEIYLQISSNTRHHVKIRLKLLIWGNCKRKSPSLCCFFIILK